MHAAPRSLALVGLGAVGRRLAQRWQRAGIAVHAWAPSVPSRDRARAEGVSVAEDLASALTPAQAVVLCVGVAELAEAAESVARALPPLSADREPACLHTSGSLGPGVLAPLARLGCPTGTLHPLAAFAPDGAGPRLDGTWCAISGDERARAAASSLVAALGARTLLLDERETAPATYHAAAALLSNGTVALASLAFELAGHACRDREDARLAFQALLRATVDNLETRTPERALTGPVSRGDAATVRAHLGGLAGDPQTRALYLALSRRMLVLAERDGRLDAHSVHELERLLAP
jgi:predicted short-subunit dehydrogenase-like oxidoreductase (DUF2520 family)